MAEKPKRLKTPEGYTESPDEQEQLTLDLDVTENQTPTPIYYPPEVDTQLSLLQAELEGYYPKACQRIDFIKHLLTGDD